MRPLQRVQVMYLHKSIANLSPPSHKQAQASGLRFENPIGHPILSEFGFEALLFPGQTAGSIVLYSTNNGGLFLTGLSDSLIII